MLGAEIAESLGVGLELIMPRKVGHPGNPEYAICVVTEVGLPVCNPEEVSHVNPIWLSAEIDRQRVEIRRRREKYLGNSLPQSAEGKICIIVDDGIATGLTMLAAIGGLRSLKPKGIVVAIPVIPYFVAQKLKGEVDELIALSIDKDFAGAVSSYYEDFSQVDDDEVIALLKYVREKDDGIQRPQCTMR